MDTNTKSDLRLEKVSLCFNDYQLWFDFENPKCCSGVSFKKNSSIDDVIYALRLQIKYLESLKKKVKDEKGITKEFIRFISKSV